MYTPTYVKVPNYPLVPITSEEVGSDYVLLTLIA